MTAVIKKKKREKEIKKLTFKLGSSYLGGKIYKGSKPGCPRIKPAVVRMGTFFYIYIYMFVCLCRVLVAALGIFSLCCRGR